MDWILSYGRALCHASEPIHRVRDTVLPVEDPGDADPIG